MHLLNVHTLALETFATDIPSYATLSHKWGDPQDEVSYHDITQPSLHPDISKKPGFAKILGCCKQAAKYQLSYIWIDTCCINKSNSVELHEAINSMWQWYLDCNRCFVYMNDVSSNEGLDADDSDFARSQWFKRGWTLQELLAPAKVIFFAEDWKKIGRKGHPTVTRRISLVTGIPEQVLLDGETTSLSVASRMFWASKRETTRREDRAYSLMGLFDITMPIIYGGIDNTFVRFQKEVMKNSVDHSIFAWTVSSASPEITTGLLTPSPAYFMNVDEIPYDDFFLGFSSRIESGVRHKADYTSTNNGIAIELPMRLVAEPVYLAMLRCTLPEQPVRPLCIYLQKLAGQRNQWVRTRIGELIPLPADGELFQNMSIFLSEDTSFFHPRKRKRAVSDVSIQTTASVPFQVVRSSSISPRSFTTNDTIPEADRPVTPTARSRPPYLSRFRRVDRPSSPPAKQRFRNDLGLKTSVFYAPSTEHGSSPPEGSMTPRASPRTPLAFNSNKGLMSIIRTKGRRRRERPLSQDPVPRWPAARSMSPVSRANAHGDHRSRSLSPVPTRSFSNALSDLFVIDDLANRSRDITGRSLVRLERSAPLGAARTRGSKSSGAATRAQTGPPLHTIQPSHQDSPRTPDRYRGRSLSPKPLGNAELTSRTPPTGPLPNEEDPVPDSPSVLTTPSSIRTSEYTASLPPSVPPTPPTVLLPTPGVSESPPQLGSSLLWSEETDIFGYGSNPVPDYPEPYSLRPVHGGPILANPEAPVIPGGWSRSPTPIQPPPQRKPTNEKGFMYKLLRFFGRTN